MTLPTRRLFTPEEYLAIERNAEQKSEYFAGEIFAMGGASERHNLIVTNIIRELGVQLKGRPCRLYANDMRVKVSPTGLYTYPDVVVMCGEARFDDEQKDTLLNPTVIIEVLSKSTEAYDRGEKAEQYRKLKSLTEYLLVAQERYHIERYARQDNDRWLLTEASDLQETVQLATIECELSLAEVYDKVEMGRE